MLLSSSSVVRALMKDGVLSDAGDVKLDHLDTTHRRRASTLAGRVLGLLAGALRLCW